MLHNTSVLISGAGIAGLTLAYWLDKFGFNPSVIEKRRDLSDKGYMIDFYGSGFDVAEKMGLLEALQARQYILSEVVIVDQDGKHQATMTVDKFRKLLKGRYISLMRGDVAEVICDNIKGRIPIKFSTTITDIDCQPDRVQVAFSDNTQGTYDLLIGAEGIHSKTRGLLWGEESRFDNFLGFYIACAVIDNFLGDDDTFYGCLALHKEASVYPIRGNRLATFFAFASDRHDLQSKQQQLDMLNEIFGDMRWIVPQLLAAMESAPHLFFDAVTQIKLDFWHQGRVALVGDACQCLTLLAGQGASMAMAGAYTLATALQKYEGDYDAAFQAYQDTMKPEIDKRQVVAQKLTKTFVPDSYLRIRLLNLFLKVAFLPGLNSIILNQVGAKSIIK